MPNRPLIPLALLDETRPDAEHIDATPVGEDASVTKDASPDAKSVIARRNQTRQASSEVGHTNSAIASRNPSLRSRAGVEPGSPLISTMLPVPLSVVATKLPAALPMSRLLAPMNVV